jgi:hypothetical protein
VTLASTATEFVRSTLCANAPSTARQGIFVNLIRRIEQ